MLTNQLFDQHVKIGKAHRDCNEINRLLAAAVVSRQFCNLLLSDPSRAIKQGYAGENFSLTADEYDLVLSCNAASLPEFARQLCKHLPGQTSVAKPVFSENYLPGY
jgi:hypothetical protein